MAVMPQWKPVQPPTAPCPFCTELPESDAFQRHLCSDGGAVNIAKFWFRPTTRNYVWSQLSSSGKSWFQLRVYLVAWRSSGDYCMYKTSILVLFRLLPFTEDVFLFEWGILMYLFFVIKLLSLLFICVPFLCHFSFHRVVSGAVWYFVKKK
jgi:hypothetical protein